MNDAPGAPLLVGRDPELSALRGLLEGAGSRLLVRGAAGTGKTALLRRLGTEATARGHLVLAAASAEREQRFPYATLHLLLQPLAAHFGRLPGAGREALRAAFGAVPGLPDVDRVADATRALLALAAAGRPPLLLTVDDQQWTDRPTRAVLDSVAGRAGAVLAAARSGAPSGDRELPLGPLSRAAAEQLLDHRAPDLPPPVRTLILDRAAGNPLALVELPAVLRDIPDNPAELPLTPRLETAFAGPAAAVSPRCRTFLLVLAAEPEVPADLALTLAGRLCGDPETADVIEESIAAGAAERQRGLLRFRHPLIRSAVYQRATLAERLAVHRALAAALSGEPVRRLAHEVAAAIGPDDDLADRLERAAGAEAADTVVLLRQAARLARHGPRRTDLLVRAAAEATDRGDHSPARALLERADLTALGPVARARVMHVEEIAVFPPDEHDRRVLAMVTASAAARAHGAPDVAAGLLWQAAVRCFHQDGGAAARAAVITELDRAGRPGTPSDLALRALADPYGQGGAVLARLAQTRAGDAGSDAETPHLLSSAAIALGDYGGGRATLTRAAAAWQADNRIELLTRALAHSWPAALTGDLDRAGRDTATARELAGRTGNTVAWLTAGATAALVAAIRGETETANRLTTALRAHRRFAGMPVAAALTQQADALTAGFGGRADEAYDLLARACDPADVHHHSVLRWAAVPDLADAAVTAGRVPGARLLIADLAGPARRLPSELVVSAWAYAGAVLADDDSAEERYAAATAAVPDGWPLLAARLNLQYGRWLRRRRRYVDARAPLRAAADEFDRIGARPWADEARRRLRATGETGHRRHRTAAGALSDQQRQVAVLAAEGLTNREIAQRLSISHRTVGSHLYRVYQVLGVTSRGQLTAALQAVT